MKVAINLLFLVCVLMKYGYSGEEELFGEFKQIKDIDRVEKVVSKQLERCKK